LFYSRKSTRSKVDIFTIRLKNPYMEEIEILGEILESFDGFIELLSLFE
jgi:hypothetical protein